MANVLGVYNPIFYAQEALIQLEAVLGMASRVYLGFDEERRAFGKGDTVNIRKPSTFTVQAAPSTAQDLNTETTPITLDWWNEVKFGLTDRELTITGQRLIDDHIRPAAVALATDIDSKLNQLVQDIPWEVDATTPAAVKDLTTLKQQLADNKGPVGDLANLHLEVTPMIENELLQLQAFSQQQGAGDAGVQTQLNGTLGRKYGWEVFMNQNTYTHVKGALTSAAPKIVGSHAKGLKSVVIDDATMTGTVKKGDSFVIAGDTQRYAITADATASGNSITVAVTPALAITYADNAAVTMSQNNFDGNIAFHRNAFSLVTAPLSEMAGELGAKVASIQDPKTGLSIRSRVFYDGNLSKTFVALDVLYGVKTLDPNLAIRLRDNIS